MTMRLFVLTTALLAPLAFAQEMDSCNAKCQDNMMTCMQKCGGDMRCTNSCQNRMMDCMKRCQKGPPSKQTTSTNNKQKKCFGADGRKVPCGDYKPTPPPPKHVKEEDEAMYPNKAAKELQNDPNFKGAMPSQ